MKMMIDHSSIYFVSLYIAWLSPNLQFENVWTEPEPPVDPSASTEARIHSCRLDPWGWNAANIGYDGDYVLGGSSHGS